jgi:hypothetical protein
MHSARSGLAVHAHGHARQTISAIVSIALIAAVAAGLVLSAPPDAGAAGFPARLIPENGAYLGARIEPRGGESQWDAVQRVESQIGRRFAIDHYYYQWNDSFPNANQTRTVSEGRIPFINWKSGSRWSAIANGSHDAEIRRHADAFNDFGSPAYLAFHHEPENDLSSFGTPNEYAAAFRHIVQVFRDRGVDNVAFVWNLMAWSFNPKSDRDPMDYYPGDGFVDFVGGDGYNWYPSRSTAEWTSFEAIFQYINQFAVDRGKPWMVVEYGCLEDPARPGRKAEWLRDVLRTAKGWPSLKALIYYDVFKAEDWITDSSASSIAAYREIARDPYLSAMLGDRDGRPNPNPSPSPNPNPATTLANSLDGGALGQPLSTDSSGGGGDAFDRVEVDPRASLTYDRAHPRDDGVTARHAVGANMNAFYAWHSGIDRWRSWSGRVYLWIGSHPSGNLRLIRSKDAAGPNFGIDLSADGGLRIIDGRNRTVARMRTAIRTDAWVRIEWRVNHETGRAEVRLFNRPDATTPTDTAGSGSGNRFSASTSVVQIGRSGRQPSSAVFWTDDPAITSGGWLGT